MVVVQDDLWKHLKHCLENSVVVLGDVGVFTCLGAEKKLEGVFLLFAFIRNRLIVDSLSVGACIVLHVVSRGCRRRRRFRHCHRGQRCFRT